MKTNRQRSAFIGAAGVYAVASRLSMLGHAVYLPSLDVGVDVMLGSGVRLQVKAGHFRKDPRTSGRYYVLDAKRMSRSIGKRKGQSKYVGIVDFVVFWAIDENRFFVFPMAEDFRGVWIPAKGDTFRRLSMTSMSHQMVALYEEAWHLLDLDSAVEATLQTSETEQKICFKGDRT